MKEEQKINLLCNIATWEYHQSVITSELIQLGSLIGIFKLNAI